MNQGYFTKGKVQMSFSEDEGHLENPMDGGAWQAAVHGVARVGHNGVTSLSLFTLMHWRRK